MKSLVTAVFLLLSAFTFAQTASTSGNIPQPKYDTINIEVKSTNSFYFCKQLYAIPRNCEDSIQSDCCSYDAQLSGSSAFTKSAQIGCYDGTTLSWIVYDNEQSAKLSFESYPDQLRKQMKNFRQTDILLQVCNKSVKALRMEYSTYDGHLVYQLMFYGTINGETVSGHLYFLNNIKSSKDLTPFFQQLVKF